MIHLCSEIGCWSRTEAVVAKKNKTELWALKCKWELPVKLTGFLWGEYLISGLRT